MILMQVNASFFRNLRPLAWLMALLLAGCGQTVAPKASGPVPPRGMSDGFSFDPSSRSVGARGWVFSPDDPVKGLVVSWDGQPLLTNLPAFGPRPDVSAALKDPRAELSGWGLAVPLPTNFPAKGCGVAVHANLASGAKFELVSSGASPLVQVPAYVPPKAADKKMDEKTEKKKKNK
jgi:hypothetical protein